MSKTDLKTRRAEILAKLSAGQKLVHWAGWPGRMSERASLEADGGVNGSDSYTKISNVDYKWLVGSGYVKQVKYEWGGRTTYEINDDVRKRGDV